eukprot:TRINITY_DN3412_c0_g1_i1.p1 TRINITY_DN3412_c0_g1~~TRINITY_DN3412_c0_g1_i1.p1  ORF type:complete len:683 (+),score=208.49 TRINITY_DN3412_c0_g1_i1:51-2051(+)
MAAPPPQPRPPSGYTDSGLVPSAAASHLPAARRRRRRDGSQVHDLDVRTFCAVAAFLHDFPRLALVCRRWTGFLRDDSVYRYVLTSLAEIDGRTCRRPVGPDPSAIRRPRAVQQAAAAARATVVAPSFKHQWLMAYAHAAWRSDDSQLMVDFATSGVSNLSNDEGALSQIYYTYPRVGLQFMRKFALFGISACTDLERVALKKGTHLGCDAIVEEAEHLVTGQARDRIVKLDFTTATASGLCQCTDCSRQAATGGDAGAATSVVVWTASGIELFTCEVNTRLTVRERRMKYSLQPAQSVCMLGTAGVLRHSDILMIHINEENVISILHSDSDTHTGKVSVFRFAGGAGQFLFSTDVPGPVRSSSGSEKGEWKSRERFEFKGSTRLGALIDDNGTVHVFHFDTRSWSSITARWWDLWREGAAGDAEDTECPAPKPKYLRAAGNCVVFWNDASKPSAGRTGPPLYFEVWRVRPCGPSAHYEDDPPAAVAAHDTDGRLWATRILCECYSSITSVHVDETRCFVHASRDNKDVIVDVWDIHVGQFVSRIYAVKNSWSLEKDQVKTYLSRLFWSSADSVIYYELNTNQMLSRNVLSFRQLSCVRKEEYWEECRRLKGSSELRQETHRIVTPHRRQYRLQLQGACRGCDGWQVTDFDDAADNDGISDDTDFR